MPRARRREGLPVAQAARGAQRLGIGQGQGKTGRKVMAIGKCPQHGFPGRAQLACAALRLASSSCFLSEEISVSAAARSRRNAITWGAAPAQLDVQHMKAWASRRQQPQRQRRPSVDRKATAWRGHLGGGDFF